MIKQVVFALVVLLGLASAQYVSFAQFQCMFPRVRSSNIEAWLPHLNNALSEYSITSTNRIMMFLAQTGHETDRYNTFVEYTNADGTNAWCHKYDGGCRFRGRGAMQLTHRSNYQRAGNALGYDYVSNPDLVAQMPHAFDTAGWFWAVNGLNTPADNQDVERATRIINGGTNGLADRKEIYAKAKQCFAQSSTPPPNNNGGGSCGTYTIRAGDSLSAIASRYGKTLDQILAVNPSIRNASLVQIGQVINLPC